MSLPKFGRLAMAKLPGRYARYGIRNSINSLPDRNELQKVHPSVWISKYLLHFARHSSVVTCYSLLRTIMIDLAPHNPYGLALRHPVLTAAGCFGYGVEYARLVNIAGIGAIVTR